MEVISIWFGTGQDPLPVNHIRSCQLGWKCTGMYTSCTFCSNPQFSQIEQSLGAVWTSHPQLAPWTGSLTSAPPHLFACLLCPLTAEPLHVFSRGLMWPRVPPQSSISTALRGGAGLHCANLPPPPQHRVASACLPSSSS